MSAPVVLQFTQDDSLSTELIDDSGRLNVRYLISTAGPSEKKVTTIAVEEGSGKRLLATIEWDYDWSEVVVDLEDRRLFANEFLPRNGFLTSTRQVKGSNSKQYTWAKDELVFDSMDNTLAARMFGFIPQTVDAPSRRPCIEIYNARDYTSVPNRDMIIVSAILLKCWNQRTPEGGGRTFFSRWMWWSCKDDCCDTCCCPCASPNCRLDCGTCCLANGSGCCCCICF